MATTNNEAEAPRGRLSDKIKATGRDEMITFVADDLDTTKSDAALIVDSVTRAIAELVRRTPLVRVPNLGNLRTIETAARVGRNPRTGAMAPIASGRRLSFRAAKSLKASINGRREV